MTISVEQYSGKKLQLNLLGDFFLFFVYLVRNLINGGFPNKKGRQQTKIQKNDKWGNAYLALESICGLNLDMVFLHLRLRFAL